MFCNSLFVLFLFVIFLLTILLYVHLLLSDFDYPFGIFKLFLKPYLLSIANDDKLFYFIFMCELCINGNEVCMIKLSFIYR